MTVKVAHRRFVDQHVENCPAKINQSHLRCRIAHAIQRVRGARTDHGSRCKQPQSKLHAGSGTEFFGNGQWREFFDHLRRFVEWLHPHNYICITQHVAG